MTAFADNFAGTAAGAIAGRVSATGHTWTNPNTNGKLNGAGQLIRDPATPAGGGTGGMYSYVTLDKPVTSMSANVSWLGPSPTINDSTDLVLAASNVDTHNGTAPNLTFFKDFLHVVIGNWSVSIDCYLDAVSQGLDLFYIYPGGTLALDGTVYPTSWELRGEILTINCPNGVAKRCANPLFAQVAGKYLGYQCYDTQYPALSPRFESVGATTDPLAGYVPHWPLAIRPGIEVDR